MSSLLRPWHVRALVLVVVLIASVAVGPVSGASADPPVPTDYRSDVVSITPSIDGLEARIVGGDSFLELVVPLGSTATVLGYRDEPYLRFLADGTVEENLLAPTTHLNRDRTGSAPVPAEASVDAPPQWHRVASDGRWAWHDHRTHWMGAEPPLGLEPGDQIVDAVVPVTVDGVAVEIAVVSVWQPEPSAWPVWFGALGGLLVAAVGLLLGRTHTRSHLVAGLIVAAAATVTGVWQHWSLPTSVGSPMRGWLLPVSAVAVLVVGLLARRAAAWRSAFVLAASVQLLQWAWLRRAVWGSAVLPTSAPFWLDRALTAATASASIVLAVAACLELAPHLRRPAIAPASRA